MSEVYKIHNPDIPYFITNSVLNWYPVFDTPNYFNILKNALKFYQENKNLEIYGYCFMPTHMHLIARCESYNLADITRDFKRYTSRQITDLMVNDDEKRDWLLEMQKEAERLKRTSKTKFCQDGYHPMEIYSDWFFKQKIDYIHNNPVEDGICKKPEDYLYSSARNYAKLKSVLSILDVNGDEI